MKTLKQYIEKAYREKVALGHFNIAELSGFKAVVESATELNLLVIIGTSEENVISSARKTRCRWSIICVKIMTCPYS